MNRYLVSQTAGNFKKIIDGLNSKIQFRIIAYKTVTHSNSSSNLRIGSEIYILLNKSEKEKVRSYPRPPL